MKEYDIKVSEKSHGVLAILGHAGVGHVHSHSGLSNDLHDTARATGIIPGTASVMSLLVPEDYIKYWKIPILTPEDVAQYMRIILHAAEKLNW